MSDTRYAGLKQRNADLNLLETRSGQLALESLPRYVLVELTQGCNLRCPMCRSGAIAYGERAMDRRVVAALADVLYPTAELVDVRGWGESLLAPDIEEIIQQVVDYGARCRIVTNLSVNRPRVLDLLADTGAMIDVSLDAVRQDVLDAVRPGSRFSLIDRNLRRLTSRLAQRGRGQDDLRLIATIQRRTLPELTDLVVYAASVGVRQIVLNEVTLAPGDPNDLQGLDEQMRDELSRATTAADRMGVELHAGTSLGDCVPVSKAGAFCLHPWTYATVGYDGSVGYCDHLIGPMMPLTHMGDITVDRFREIWNGERWMALRRWHSTTPRIDDGTHHACFQCYKHRNVDFEDMFDPRLRRHKLDVISPTGTS